jgi:hypothetical protein
MGSKMIGANEFKAATYARTKDGIVFIQGFNGGSYQAVRTDRDEEGEYSSSELTPWSPSLGERVIEANDEDCVTGIVIGFGDGTSLVEWNGFACPQTWPNSKLEPAWD